MARFRDIKTLQKFASVHASIHNHFNHDRHLNRRDTFKQDGVELLSKVGDGGFQAARSISFSPSLNLTPSTISARR